MKATQVKVPATRPAAFKKLGGLGSLLTATKWEASAILTTFVRLDNPAGRPSKSVRTDRFLTPADVADMGIKGFTSKNTVRRYVQAWLDNNDGQHPEPGDVVALPEIEFPVLARNEKAAPVRIETETGARKAIEKAIERFPDVVADVVSSDTKAMGKVHSAYSEKHPPPPPSDRYLPDESPLGLVALLDVLGTAVRVIDARMPEFTMAVREGQFENGEQIADEWRQVLAVNAEMLTLAMQDTNQDN